MSGRAAKVWAVATVSALFTGWELLKHAFMMDLPMPQAHLVSLAVETLIAVAVAIAAVSGVSAYERQAKRADEFGRLIGHAVGTSVVVETALGDIRREVAALQHSQLPAAEIQRRAAQIAASTERVGRIVSQLSSVADLMPGESR